MIEHEVSLSRANCWACSLVGTRHAVELRCGVDPTSDISPRYSTLYTFMQRHMDISKITAGMHFGLNSGGGATPMQAKWIKLDLDLCLILRKIWLKNIHGIGKIESLCL